jgi:uncharacterized protein YkwD
MQNRTIPRSALTAAIVCAALALIASAAILSAGASDAPAGPPAQAAATPAATPSLLDILRSAQALHDAGLLPPPREPSLLEILRSAQVLHDAGLLPVQSPPLIEILRSAQALVGAGLLAPPGGPSMLDILTAVQLLARAGALPGQQAEAEPPLAPVDAQQPDVAAPPPPPPGPARWSDAGYSSRVFALVNAQRANAGLRPLGSDARLANAASAYAKVLADNHWFSHSGPDGSTFVQRIEAAGVPFTVPFGEILASGTQSWSPESLVQAWMNSQPHRADILSSDYSRAGAGCYFTPADGVTVYCVIDFAG